MFCWGDGSSGQFGLNFENVSVPIAGNIFSDKVTEIACGEQHTLFLTVDGRILSCGRNSKGQLGRQRNINSKLPVEGLGAVVSVSCGQDHSVAVCASGQVYSWGAGGEGQLGIAPTTVSKVLRPVPIPSPLPITVIQVACGNSHSLALTTGGQVFSWGLNSHGQLGLGKGVPLQPIPALVRPLTGVPVTQVAAGGTHTLALTLPGLVYCCGANRAGQLGLNRVDEKVLGVSFISCGEAHSAVLTKGGQVFTFGEGSRGQLGHNASANELLPKLVEGMDGLASQIACGSHHTLVLGSSGQLWAFGSGVKGQLGTGNTGGSLQPTSVLLKRDSGGAATVIHNGTRYNVYSILFFSILYLILFNAIIFNHYSSATIYTVLINTVLFTSIITITPYSLPDVPRFYSCTHSQLKAELQYTDNIIQQRRYKLFEEEWCLFLFILDLCLDSCATYPYYQPRVEEKSYFLFGVLCGMALYNHNIVHLPFPLALFKKMVGVKPSLEDMREFDPVVGGRLRYLLEDYTDDDVEENLDMTFTVIWDDQKVELDPKETGKPVTSFNRKQFVDAYVNLAFNQSAEKVFEEFRRGFFKVCDRDVVELFQPEELRGVMVGKEDYDWDTLKQNTVYDGEYHARHPNIITFWEAFEELTADQKKAFLLFLTGCGRVPILGMDKIQMKVAVLQNSTELHFPESLTCHFLLLLPIYPSKEMLLARLKEACAHNRGFWKE
uniref:HECT domain-containing protein n=1 Tax=Oncorhynchus mykiss TaxID=8022 RepID=A0A8C7TVG6_ONCMY